MFTKNSTIHRLGVTSFGKNIIGPALMALVVITGACQKQPDEDIAPAPDTTTSASTGTVNDWILENMQTYYYWNDQIQANPDRNQDPEDFFNSLLYKFDASQRPDGDRFSFVQENAEELKASLSGQQQSSGAEYALYLRSQGSEDVIAQILYVQPGSPADKAGLKRGNIIYQVNGQTINKTNYYSLLFEQKSQVLGIANWENNQLVNSAQTVNVSTEVLQENPILMDSVYTIGSKKIGYLVYNQFIPAPNGSKVDTYDQQINSIFGSFAAAGINELIVDLRYNPGGYVSSAVNLASLIGKGVDASKVFYRQEWNKVLTPELQKEYGDDFFIEKFTANPQNIGNLLSRVYVITSEKTASASELLINGLRPYMEVVTVGSTTVGKNVGSITLTDDTKKIKWGLQPIVFKSYNSLGQSDYTTGITPNVEIEETLDLKPFGDVKEAILDRTIKQITGAPTARLGISRPQLPQAGSSIDRKAGGSNMFDERITNLPANVQ